MFWKALFATLVIPLVALPSTGCKPLATANPPSSEPETVEPNPVISPTPVEPNPSVPNAEQLRSLTPCLQQLSKPQISRLTFYRVDAPSDGKPEPKMRVLYFSAYSTASIANPYLFETNKVPEFTSIALKGQQCTILTRSNAEAVAKKLMKARYPDLVRLSKGDLEAVKGDVVNRWEQDRRVGSDDSAPFLMAIEDIWAFKILNLGLPNYVPIEVSR